MIDVLMETRERAEFTAWIDIENPPQVQYLLPFRDAFRAAGVNTIVTARDYGSTLTLLDDAGVHPYVFGKRVGRGKARKAVATAKRARELSSFFELAAKPDAALSVSRSAAIAARRLGVPNFVMIDYEHAFLRLYRFTRSVIMFPNVIDPANFRRKGLRDEQLMAIQGIKEDLTFAGVDAEAVEPFDLGPLPEGAVRVLCRPPSETSHYYRKSSTTMARATLQRLAEAGALVVFSPREPRQAALLEGLPWKHEPVTLTRAVPFVSLLKSVDLVVCSGGTMLREAAYLGIPAYSIFQSEIGGVDRWLERIGRARLIARPEDLDQIELKPRGPLNRLDSNPNLLDQIVSIIAPASTRAGGVTNHRPPSPATVIAADESIPRAIVG